MSLFAFVPWLAFLNQHPQLIRDAATLRLAISHDPACAKPEAVFDSQIAQSFKARQRGLSNRPKPLSKAEAMLFVFNSDQPIAFWMKDTLIPLDIIFFSGNGTARSMTHMPVERDPSRPTMLYRPEGTAALALEVAPGSLSTLNRDRLTEYRLCAAPQTRR